MASQAMGLPPRRSTRGIALGARWIERQTLEQIPQVGHKSSRMRLPPTVRELDAYPDAGLIMSICLRVPRLEDLMTSLRPDLHSFSDHPLEVLDQPAAGYILDLVYRLGLFLSGRLTRKSCTGSCFWRCHTFLLQASAFLMMTPARGGKR